MRQYLGTKRNTDSTWRMLNLPVQAFEPARQKQTTLLFDLPVCPMLECLDEKTGIPHITLCTC